ncbi:MAG: hypothetical protein US50_C0064G0006 [Candidatus Nomurabacteria bacterium GW2011_GWB1_37_5]|uniref:Methyltransferase small domain-containing protein n=1 Tax=Candidatus Nomurabacteria bacterium GW2011_GWB1_37_5 TaxID=1618742 RepID=A0A0G0JBC3_9BACT|nr:MAG: hypothetical protein US50_C0064G0006 [Candidatus Nomurabacteria bacterium GW2011_GWB1_37_5]
MLIKFDKNLINQDIYAEGVELRQIMGDRPGKKPVPEDKKRFVARLKSPVLVTDMPEIVRQLRDSTVRDTVFQLFQAYPRTVEYDGVGAWWLPQRHKNVWCPSIDTLVFARALKKILSKNNNFIKAAEVGCGSGFLSKYISLKNKNTKVVNLFDINPYALLCARDNIVGIKKKFNFSIKDWKKESRNKKYDLLICNPPYIPRPKSLDNNPYEGLSLIREILFEGPKHLNQGGVIMTTYSSLCEKEFKNYVKEAGIKYEVMEKMRVPLKVLPVLNNKEWMKYLTKTGKLKKHHEKGYHYWQTIYIVKIQP